MGSVQPRFLGRGTRGPPKVIARGASLRRLGVRSHYCSTTIPFIYSNMSHHHIFFIISIYLLIVSLHATRCYLLRVGVITTARPTATTTTAITTIITITTAFRYQYLYHFHDYYSIEAPSREQFHINSQEVV